NMMSASSAPSPCTNGSDPGPKTRFVSGSFHRYICIVGAKPSGGVLMFAWSVWSKSASPIGPFPRSSVLAPSSACPSTGSPPRPWPDGLNTWKVPARCVKPIGAASRCWWYSLRNQKSCVALWRRFVRQEKAPFRRESHEHGYLTVHGEFFVFENGTNGNAQFPSLFGRTSSDFSTTLSSFTSVETPALSPNRRLWAKR